MFALLAVLCLAVAATNGQHIPAPPVRYYAAGTIELPYADIVEPYEAWVDGLHDQSRIDTYNGLASVYQRSQTPGRYGSISKIVYETTEEYTNRRMCFQVNGSAESQVHAQPLIPRNLPEFAFEKGSFCTGDQKAICNVYKYETSVGEKVNTYRLTLRQMSDDSFVPVTFHYLGFNRLFGSHFDEYLITYKQFQMYTLSSPFPVDTFLPEAHVGECTGFPGPGITTPTDVFDRVATISEPEEDHIDLAFDNFKVKHSKKYTSDKEHFERSRMYRANHHFVESMNRRKLTYRLKLNHLADLSPAERKMMRGLKRSENSVPAPGSKLFQPSEELVASMSSSVDWRNTPGVVSYVKDQAICGSCWSFSTTGVIEGAYFLKNLKPVVLSQQNLMDCTWGEGNNACDGGEQFRSYQWIMKHGGVAESQVYGHYLMQDGLCREVSEDHRVNISGFSHVQSFNETQLMLALTRHPVAVNIDASHTDFGFYSHGVYYNPQCGNKPDQLDHAVLAIGYGTVNGSDYWIVKNSWSTHWGNNGYILMSRKDNNCGVATDATFVEM